jgi:hypothetical protein
MVVGFATATWSLAGRSEAEENDFKELVNGRTKVQSSEVGGYLRYSLVEAWIFDEFQQIPDFEKQKKNDLFKKIEISI